MPVSELIEHDTRAIKASVVSSASLVAETEDRVMHEIWPTPTDPHRAQGLEPPDPNSGIQQTRVQTLAREGPEATSRRARARGENTDEPQQPSPNLHRGD